MWKRAAIPAVGQHTLSLQTFHQRTGNQFDSEGRVQSLGGRYGQAVSWGDLLKAERTVQGERELRGYMEQRGLSERDVAARTTYQIERDDLTFALAWGYTLASNWKIGVEAPVIFRRTKVKSQTHISSPLDEGFDSQQAHSILSSTKSNVRQRARGLVDQKLNQAGYDDVPEDRKSWQWSDVSIYSQVEMVRGYDWNWSLQQSVRFPAARNPSVRDYIQTNADDGQMDLGLTSLLDHKWRHWIVGWRMGYVAQLPDTLRMRPLPGESPTSVRRDLGDYGWSAVDGEYAVLPQLKFNLEYAVLIKQGDRYRGESHARHSTRDLEQDTSQELHQSRAKLIYDLGLGKRAREGREHKWLASVDYTHPWHGRNSSNANRAGVELIGSF